MKPMTRLSGVAGMLSAMVVLASPAFADGRNWNDGAVVNVAAIRTVDGHFDDYMHWLATTWRKQEEAAKAAGLIISYQVLVAEPQGPNDPDIYLVTKFKNWAALDHLGGKLDKVSTEVWGTLEKATQTEIDRGKIRTVLGSQTMQVAELK